MNPRMRMERIDGRSRYFKRRKGSDPNLIFTFFMVVSIVLSVFYDEILDGIDPLNLREMGEKIVYSIRVKMLSIWLQFIRSSYAIGGENDEHLEDAILSLFKSRMAELRKLYNLKFENGLIVGKYVRFGVDGWIEVMEKPKMGSKIVDPRFGVVGVVDYCEKNLCHVGSFENGYKVEVRLDGSKVRCSAELFNKGQELFLRIMDVSLPKFLKYDAVVFVSPSDPDYPILERMGYLKIGRVIPSPKYTRNGILLPLDSPRVESEYLILIDSRTRGK